jgi:hypothetical protein
MPGGLGQLAVAALAVVLALLLAVALAQALPAPAGAGEIPGAGEALGITRLQRDGQPENLPDAGHVLHPLEGLPFFGGLHDVLLDLGDGFLDMARTTE